MTKTCCKCKIEKTLEEFPWRFKAKNIKQPYCSDCRKIYAAKWYKKHKGTLIPRAIVNSNQRREVVYNWLLDYFLEHPCVECGESNPVMLEFDHLDRNNKRKEVSCLMSHSRKTLEDEIEKCQVLCSNCHRLRTAKQFNQVLYRLCLERGIIK